VEGRHPAVHRHRAAWPGRQKGLHRLRQVMGVPQHVHAGIAERPQGCGSSSESVRVEQISVHEPRPRAAIQSNRRNSFAMDSLAIQRSMTISEDRFRGLRKIHEQRFESFENESVAVHGDFRL